MPPRHKFRTLTSPKEDKTQPIRDIRDDVLQIRDIRDRNLGVPKPRTGVPICAPRFRFRGGMIDWLCPYCGYITHQPPNILYPKLRCRNAKCARIFGILTTLCPLSVRGGGARPVPPSDCILPERDWMPRVAFNPKPLPKFGPGSRVVRLQMENGEVSDLLPWED